MAPIPILYDADCGFCRACLGLVLAWDRGGELRPVALEDAEAEQLLAGMSPEQRMASWHLVTPDRAVHSAGAAFPPLLRRLPGGPPLASLAERFPGAAERGYRWVADHRSAWGRLIPASLVRRADDRLHRQGAGQP